MSRQSRWEYLQIMYARSFPVPACGGYREEDEPKAGHFYPVFIWAAICATLYPGQIFIASIGSGE